MNTSKANNWKKFKKLNWYFQKNIKTLTAVLVPNEASIVEFGSLGGELLSSLPNKNKVGIENDRDLIDLSIKKHKKIEFTSEDTFFKSSKKYDYLLLNHRLSTVDDVQVFLQKTKKHLTEESRVIVYNFNYFWKPALDLAKKFGLMMPWTSEPNWLSTADIENFFYLEGFETVRSGNITLLPYFIPVVSPLMNRFMSQLPLIHNLCFTQFSVYRLTPKPKEYSVTIVIPARNEAGHMRGVLRKIPKIGTKTEVVFVEGGSKDDTYEVIKQEIRSNKTKIKAVLYKQKGKGKGDAVRLGFSKASNELLMILDADLTVPPADLTKFYDCYKQGRGELVMGSRLVYPMENEAMRTLNYLGNKVFSMLFSFLLGQRIKDTLCGTKVLTQEVYKKIANNRHVFGDFDPFGDFDLIFGAARLNMKIVEIPIRYKERVYGTTNISRYKHGLLLFRMVAVAAQKLKFI